MKALVNLAKLVTAGFWLVVLVSLFGVFAAPFDSIIPLAGLAILVVHMLEAVVWRRALSADGKFGKNVIMVLIFGVFHMASRQVTTAKP